MSGTQSQSDEQLFADESIAAKGEPGDIMVYIGQSWHTTGVNVTDDRAHVALVGQWIPRYFRGATDLDDIDPVVLTGMSAVARRVL